MPKEFANNSAHGKGATIIIPEPRPTSGDAFECPHCGQTFLERDTYKDHYRQAHT